jgi:RNA polymerase sigma-70 factor (ECF subfamily)
MSESAERRDRLYAEAAAEFGAALERLARGYERDPDRRRDLLQEIHVALWRSLARFDGRCSLRTWVYRVAHNTSVSHAIRPAVHAPAFVAPDEDLESMPDAFDGEEQLDRQRALERLYDLIRRLRPPDRQVMLLYLEDVEATAIGEVTGLSATNVAKKVQRIKQLLVRRFYERVTDGQ